MPHDLLFGRAQLGWNVRIRKRLMDVAGPGRLRCLIIPVFLVEGIKSFLKLSHLLQHNLALMIDEGQPFADGGIPLYAPIDKLFDLFDGHSRFFEALDDGEPFKIGILEHPDAPTRSFDKGEKTLFIVITQGGGGEIHIFGHFTYSIGHFGRLQIYNQQVDAYS